MTKQSSQAKEGSSDSTLNDERSRFILLSSEIAEMAASVNIPVVPFLNPRLPHFSNLDSSSRSQTLRAVSFYHEVFSSTRRQGFSLLDSGRVVWNFLRLLRGRPTSDLFRYFEYGNVIEIHDTNLVQLFRNFDFFKFCTYSLEELYCYPFTHLYRRENEVEHGIIEAFSKIHRGEISHVIPVNVAPHVISETCSTGLLRISAEVKYVAPLFYEKTNTVMGTIVIEEGKVCRRTQSPAPTTTFSPENSF